VWQARPNLHLGFHNAPPKQRLYTHCPLPVTEYIRRWESSDFAQVGAHRYDEVRDGLWPWLQEHQYTGPTDDEQLDVFLGRLGRRDAHLRPGVKVWRTWPGRKRWILTSADLSPAKYVKRSLRS
jgi:hypothetical protein